MSDISAVTIFLMLLIIIFKIDSNLGSENFNRNYWRAASFNCLHPQPRAFSVTEITTTGLSGKIIIPRMIVLHVCDYRSGCCLDPAGSVCGPVDIENVELTFHVTYAVNSGTYKAGDTAYESYVFRNHTKCGCLDKIVWGTI